MALQGLNKKHMRTRKGQREAKRRTDKDRNNKRRGERKIKHKNNLGLIRNNNKKLKSHEFPYKYKHVEGEHKT